MKAPGIREHRQDDVVEAISNVMQPLFIRGRNAYIKLAEHPLGYGNKRSV